MRTLSLGILLVTVGCQTPELRPGNPSDQNSEDAPAIIFARIGGVT